MKKIINRIISVLFIFVLLLQTALASDKEVKVDNSAEAIGKVPKKFQTMVNGNWAIASGDFSKNGYYHLNADDGEVKIDKYNIYGKKLYSAEYDYKYAGKDNFGFNYRFNNNLLRYTSSDGSAYVTSHTLRILVFLNINFSSKSVLTKIGSDGETLWQHKLSKKDGDMFSTVVEAPNGNVIISCSTFRKFFGEMERDEYTSSLLQLDSNGEKLNSKKFEDGIMWFSDIVCVEDGFFAIGKEFSDSFNNDKNYLCAFDYDLNLLWKYEIEEAVSYWSKNDVCENGYPVWQINGKEKTEEKTLIRVDFEKNIVSKNSFKSTNKNEALGFVHLLENGEYLVEYECNYNEAVYSEQNKYERYSKGGQKLGKVDLVGYGIYDILETKNEIIFCCWNALNYDDNGDVGDRECVYTAFDKDWNLLWQKGVAEK